MNKKNPSLQHKYPFFTIDNLNTWSGTTCQPLNYSMIFLFIFKFTPY